MAMRIGVYPGTFDPLTLGHMDIIRRGARLVDRLVIGVATNPSKSPMFTIAERKAQVGREVADLPGVEVVEFDELIEAVWAPAVVGEETVTQRVKLLRQALGDDGRNPRYVRSIRGRGYQLCGPVVAVDASFSSQVAPVAANPSPSQR